MVKRIDHIINVYVCMCVYTARVRGSGARLFTFFPSVSRG